MAFPTDIATNADYTVFAPNVWGDRVNNILRKKLVIADFFIDRSEELGEGGKTLETPNITEMTANSKTNGAAVTLNSPTETKVTLTVDQWYEVSFLIEDNNVAQFKASYYLQNKLASNAGYTISVKLEVALATLFSGFSSIVGLSTQAPVDSDIRKAIGIYEGANNDPADGAFFFDKKVIWNGLMGLDRFVLNANTPGGDPVNNGLMGALYDYPVRGSNNIQYVASTTGRNNALASKDALHWARSPLPMTSPGAHVGEEMGVRLQSNYIPEYLGTLVTADLLYGCIENRDAGGVLFRTKAY